MALDAPKMNVTFEGTIFNPQLKGRTLHHRHRRQSSSGKNVGLPSWACLSAVQRTGAPLRDGEARRKSDAISALSLSLSPHEAALHPAAVMDLWPQSQKKSERKGEREMGVDGDRPAR